MNAKRLVFLLALSAALGVFADCGGGTSTPAGPEPPILLTFSGTVTSGGAGLASVQVVLSGDAARSARTDSQGTFSFAGVSGNKFVVTPSLEGYIFNPSKYDLASTSRTDLAFTAAKSTVAGGDTAPDFTALDQNGQIVSLYSYRGKVVLINISADWCGACRVEAPQLEALYQKYKDQGFQALTILVDGSAAAWASTYNVTHPVIEDKSRSISNPYATGWFPTQVILDRTMIIRYKEGEDYDEDRIVALIKPYL
jgi:peroxiredoxin